MIYLTRADRAEMECARWAAETGWLCQWDRSRLAEVGAPVAWPEVCAAIGAAAIEGREFVHAGEPIGTACRWQGIDREGNPGTGTLYAYACRIAWH